MNFMSMEAEGKDGRAVNGECGGKRGVGRCGVTRRGEDDAGQRGLSCPGALAGCVIVLVAVSDSSSRMVAYRDRGDHWPRNRLSHDGFRLTVRWLDS